MLNETNVEICLQQWRLKASILPMTYFYPVNIYPKLVLKVITNVI